MRCKHCGAYVGEFYSELDEHIWVKHSELIIKFLNRQKMKDAHALSRCEWITDWNNIGYPFSEQGWTTSNITQTHIARQNEDHRTLCGADSTAWGGANPEPDNPNPDICYASCKRCAKIYYKLRSRARCEMNEKI